MGEPSFFFMRTTMRTLTLFQTTGRTPAAAAAEKTVNFFLLVSMRGLRRCRLVPHEEEDAPNGFFPLFFHSLFNNSIVPAFGFTMRM